MEVNRGNGTSEMFFNKLHKDVIKFVCRQVISIGHPIKMKSRLTLTITQLWGTQIQKLLEIIIFFKKIRII